MTYGTRKGSIIGENIAAQSAQSATNRWITRRKSMCWVCQKEKSIYEGTTSNLGRKEGKLFTNMNNLKKFVCFACKPEVKA